MKIIISLVLLSLSTFRTFGQWDEREWYMINFEVPYECLTIDTSNNNIWEIGEPQSLFFDSAYSSYSAIVTDLDNNYPVNCISHFDILIGDFNSNWYPDNYFIEIHHKFATDTLKDGGYITVSYDNGETWTNIMNDTINVMEISPYHDNIDYSQIQNLYGLSDTLYNGEYGFSGKSDGWKTTRFGWAWIPAKNGTIHNDTTILRFNFISDNIESEKEGWMIDNIKLYSVDFGGDVFEPNNIKMSIAPNPMTDWATIYLNDYDEIELFIHDINGRLLRQSKYFNNQVINISKQNFSSGTYLVKIINSENATGFSKLIIK